MRHNTPFYIFNKDNMEHVTQVKAMWSIWDICLAKMTSHSEVFRRFAIKVSALQDVSKEDLKPLTLFLGKKLNIHPIEIDFNILH